jgi:regulatory protein NPR1
VLLDLRKIQVLGWFYKLGEQQQEIQGAADEMNLEEQPLKSLSEDLLSLLVNGQAFSDVTFAVEGRHVYAHKCVLAARSPFFRMIFCGNAQQMQMWDDDHQHHHHTGTVPQTTTTTAAAAIHVAQQAVIPVGIVGHDVFMLLLQFLYSGTLSFSPQNHVSSLRSCKEKGCWHTHCSSAVEFALETLNAAHFFGMDQLSTLTQKHLAAMAEKASIKDVMRILVAARKQIDGPHLWALCSKLVAKSGLPSDVLQKHLPADVVVEIELIRQKTGYHGSYDGGSGSSISNNALSEQRTKRMQKALDSSDVELVNMMVMGEGLNLDKALALHYAVSNCSRKVVKTLLDLGAANVNLQGLDGRTPLHMVAEAGDPEMIAMLLDHQADPHIRTANGRTAIDIVQAVAADALASSGTMTMSYSNHPSIKGSDRHNRLRLCLELLERAAAMTVVHAGATSKLDSGSCSVSTFTEHGSISPFQQRPDESNDNNFASIPRRAGAGIIQPLAQGAQLRNNDFYSSPGSQGKGELLETWC